LRAGNAASKTFAAGPNARHPWLMKAPIVALAATAAGFAAASAYLYGELSIERVQTQAEVEARSKHEAHTKQLHQSLPAVTDGESSQASMLPFSELQSSRFVAPDVAPPAMTEIAKAYKPAEPTKETDVREERAATTRLTRQLMRERATLPEPAAH